MTDDYRFSHAQLADYIDKVRQAWRAQADAEVMTLLRRSRKYVEGNKAVIEFEHGKGSAVQADDLLRKIDLQLGTGSESAPGLAQCSNPPPARELSDGQKS